MSGEREDEARRGEVERLFAAGAAPLPEALRARAAEIARQLPPGAAELAPGAMVGPYEVESVLALGGQATVYRARHRETRAWVALKVPRRALAERIVGEAKILFTLDHPRIVRIEAASIEGPVPYLALEYLPGGSLADVLRTTRGPLHLRVIRDIAAAVLEALDFAHGRGVVHRDIKPANILLAASGAAGAKVADFGIGTLALGARADAPLAPSLASGGTALAGTPLYMAPEQEDGAHVDGRADLFALGKVLYEAISDCSPRTVRPVSRERSDVPPAWDAFIFKLVEDCPWDRFVSAKAALEALRKLPLVERENVPGPPHARSGPLGGTSASAFAVQQIWEAGRYAGIAEAARERASDLRARAGQGAALPAPSRRMALPDGFFTGAAALASIALAVLAAPRLYDRFLPGREVGWAALDAFAVAFGLFAAGFAALHGLRWLLLRPFLRATIAPSRAAQIVAGIAASAVGLGIALYVPLLAPESPQRALRLALAGGLMIGLGLMAVLSGLARGAMNQPSRPRASGGAGELPGPVRGPRGPAAPPALGARAQQERALARLGEILAEAERAKPGLAELVRSVMAANGAPDLEASRAILEYVEDPARRAESGAVLERLGLLFDVEAVRAAWDSRARPEAE
jgi:tRNA A-37 threonylcarbamoyl transferase component Bud32